MGGLGDSVGEEEELLLSVWAGELSLVTDLGEEPVLLPLMVLTFFTHSLALC